LSVSVSYINYGKNKHCQHLLIIYATERNVPALTLIDLYLQLKLTINEDQGARDAAGYMTRSATK